MKKTLVIVAFVASLLFLSFPATAQTVGPAAYLTEQVGAHYDTDGTLNGTAADFPSSVCDTNPCRYGYSEVAVSNSQDVLQYIRVNISDTTNTDLDTPTASKGALASQGSPWDRTKLRFNTTADDSDPYYNITDGNQAPAIQLSLDYSNTAGGSDLYSADNMDTSVNTVDFNLTVTNPSTTHNLNGVNITVQFKKDTGTGGEDIISITAVDTAGGSSTDSDGDGYNDVVEWSGDLGTGSSQNIVFHGEIEEGVNFNGTEDSVDLDADNRGASSYWENNAGTHTGHLIDGRFSRGPIRQGTDLSSSETQWTIRGFMENLASDLTYVVHDWSLYNVTADGDLDQAVQSGTFTENITSGHGRVYTTDEIGGGAGYYETGETDKPYFATEMNWEVVWNDTNSENHFAYINTTLNLPVMYKVDMLNTKTLEGVLNEISGEEINVTDTTKHQGSPETKASDIELLSRVPGTNLNDEAPSDKTESNQGDTFFAINETENVTVYFNNGTDYELTGGYSLDIKQPTYNGEDGLVNVTISDPSAVPQMTGDLNQSEELRVEYSVYTNYSMDSGDQFRFGGNNTYVTQSGTPMTEAHQNETISVSGKVLTGYKDLIAPDAETPTVINGTLVVEVTDTEGTGISGIIFTDYVPRGTNFSSSDVTVEKYDNDTGSWEWEAFNDYNVTDQGEVTLPSGEVVEAYEYTDNTTGDGWDLFNDEKIRVSYTFNITNSGLYEMPATLAGIDPDTGVELGTTAIGDVRVNIPDPTQKLDVREGDISLASRVSVGDMAEWMKPVEVYNPNSRPTEGTFAVDIFDEIEKAWVQYTDEDGETVRIEGDIDDGEEVNTFTWKDEVPALSTRTYEVRAMTAPVMEVDRDVEVVDELPGEMVELDMSVFVRNFAKEKYEEVVLDLPIPEENIRSVETGFGEELEYSGGEASTTIFIDEIGPDELREVKIRYKQSYPTVVVTPEKDSYDLDSPVNISVLVINGGQTIDKARLESEIVGPGRKVVLSEIESLEDLEPLQETELTEEYVLSPDLPSGEYMAQVRFREDFTTLASGTGNFYVEGAFDPAGGAFTALILILAVAGAGYLTYKRLGSIRGGKR